MPLRIGIYGAIVGSLMSVILWGVMYTAARHPRTRVAEVVFDVAMVLWPTSPVLMAAQGPGVTSFGVMVFATAVLSNAVLYAVIAMVSWLALRRLGVGRSKRK